MVVSQVKVELLPYQDEVEPALLKIDLENCLITSKVGQRVPTPVLVRSWDPK